MTSTQLEVVLLGAMGVGLTLYVLLGGADFGGGVWDLLARGPRHQDERDLISHAIGPVWEANHVWLIFVVTALFAAFPQAFADLGVALYLPFGIALAGIVFRGAAFAFRAHGDPGAAWGKSWSRVFGVASLVTPVVLGMSAAAIASGRINVAGGAVTNGLLDAWTGPLSWAAGALALVICAYLAATYLTVEAEQQGDEHLRELFRSRAIASGVAAGVLAGVGLVATSADAPHLWHGMLHRGWPFVLLSGVGGVVSLAATVRRHPKLARAGAALAVASVVGGWGVAQWPYLIVPDVKASDVAAPIGSLRAITVGYTIGALLVAPSLFLLLRVFKGSRSSPDRPAPTE
ncbi:MAG: cytochrome bd ubiquinol oxidase subunit [Actinomycetota bacterium]|nr:cytochrome bd ubiquinol oxidase subunit [Actinomycetota bacterium]